MLETLQISLTYNKKLVDLVSIPAVFHTELSFFENTPHYTEQIP